MAHAHSTLDSFVVGCDHQREWIERRGLLLLLAFYLGGVGGGLYIASLVIGWQAGLAIALGIVGIGKGSTHLLFLGRPLRFWRAFRRPHSSWVSRGIIFMVLFLLLGLLHYVFFSEQNSGLMISSGFFAACLVMYTGFAMAASPGISFWNNPLLPILFGAASLSAGIAFAELSHAIRPEIAITYPDRLEPLGVFVATAVVLIIFSYLVASFQSTIASKESVAFLTWSNFAPVFYIGVIVLGIIIPLAVLIPAYLGEVARGWTAVAGISELLGSLALRFSLLKAGIYPAVI